MRDARLGLAPGVGFRPARHPGITLVDDTGKLISSFRLENSPIIRLGSDSLHLIAARRRID